jgi:hypothetical protein
VRAQRSQQDEFIWRHACLHFVAGLVHRTANLQQN